MLCESVLHRVEEINDKYISLNKNSMNSADDCGRHRRQTTTIRFSGHRTHSFSLLIHARHATPAESVCASKLQLWNDFLFLSCRTYAVFCCFDGNDVDLLFRRFIRPAGEAHRECKFKGEMFQKIITSSLNFLASKPVLKALNLFAS